MKRALAKLLIVGLVGCLSACMNVLTKGRKNGGGDGATILGGRKPLFATLFDPNYYRSVRAEIFNNEANAAGPRSVIFYNKDGSELSQLSVPLSGFLPPFSVGAYKVSAYQSGNEVFRAKEGTVDGDPVIVEACIDNSSFENNLPRVNLIITEQFDPQSSAAPAYLMGFNLVFSSGESVEIPLQASDHSIVGNTRMHNLNFGTGETVQVTMEQVVGAPCRLSGTIPGPNGVYSYPNPRDLLRKYRDL